MIKHEEVRKSFQTIKNKRVCTDWGDTLEVTFHKLYDFNHKAFDDIEQYITEQEKKDELLGLYRELHETQDMVTYENILDQIKELEEALKWQRKN